MSEYFYARITKLGEENQNIQDMNIFAESINASKKAESRCINWKAIEEDFLGFLGNRKAVEVNRILSEENRILGEGNHNIREGFHDISKRLSSDPS